MVKFLSIIVGTLFSLTSLAQTGAIKGTVTTSDGKPAETVNVFIKTLNTGTSTNQIGKYLIQNLKEGTYIIAVSAVGLDKQEQQATVVANETAVVNFTLKETAQQLNEVVVTAWQDYTREPSVTVDRMEIRQLENPRSVQVINRTLLDDRQAQSVAEATKMMVGVNAFSSSQYSDYSLRGFRAGVGSFAYNGLRTDFYQFDQAALTYNIESIEAIKGPASVLFSAGNPGGVINHITKKPFASPRYELNYTFGSFNQHRAMADATGAISNDEKLKYRLVGGYENTGQFNRNQDIENIFVAPQLQYDFNENTSIRYEFNYAYDNRTMGFDRGTPAKDNGDGTFDIFAYDPSENSVIDPNGYSERNIQFHQLEFNHEFYNNIKWTTLIGAVNTEVTQQDMYRGFRDYASVNDSLYTYDNYWNEQLWNYQLSTFINFKLNEGGNIRHNLVAGLDGNISGRNAKYASFNERTISVLNPKFGWGVFSEDDIDFNNSLWSGGWNEDASLFAVYLQDQISIGNQWKLMLGSRLENHNGTYEDFDVATNEIIDGSENELDALQFIPRAGLVYLPTKTLSVYYNYSQAFIPQPLWSQSAKDLEPEKSRQHEIGAKKEWMNGKLLTSIALYHIQKYDVAALDPSDPSGLSLITIDDVTSEGVELSAQGKVTKNLDLIANYAFNETFAIPSEGFDFTPVEGPFPQAPRHNANIWAKYTLLDGKLKNLSIGAGANHISERTTFYEDFTIPGFTTLDAAINYKIKGVNLRLNVYNITNTRYITGAYGPGALWQGNPTSFRLNIGYVF